MATDQKAKKMKQSQEEEDLLRHVLSLRSRAPQQYSINLIKQNVKYFKNLNKIDTASGEPFAPIYKHEPYEIELSDDLFQQQKSKANEIQRKVVNAAKCLAMRREHNSLRQQESEKID